MIPTDIFQRIATHYFYRHLPEEIYVKLEKLLIAYYIDEDKEPLDNEMVESAINFLNDIFYK